jgi:hypothetical protein
MQQHERSAAAVQAVMEGRAVHVGYGRRMELPIVRRS